MRKGCPERTDRTIGMSGFIHRLPDCGNDGRHIFDFRLHRIRERFAAPSSPRLAMAYTI